MNLKLVFLPALLWTLVKADNFPIDEDEVFDMMSAKAGDEKYRLPEVLDPTVMNVEITPYFEATANKERWTFDGIVTITVKVS